MAPMSWHDVYTHIMPRQFPRMTLNDLNMMHSTSTEQHTNGGQSQNRLIKITEIFLHTLQKSLK